MSRSPCSMEEILTICHVSWPLIGTIVGVVSRVQSALYTYLISHNKTNNTCCYGTSQFVIRNNWQKIILTCFRSFSVLAVWAAFSDSCIYLSHHCWQGGPWGPPFLPVIWTLFTPLWFDEAWLKVVSWGGLLVRAKNHLDIYMVMLIGSTVLEVSLGVN